MKKEDENRGEKKEIKKRARPSDRKKRIPLGVTRLRMALDEFEIPKGQVARWVNDKPGRISAAKRGGYEFVDDPEAEIKVGEGTEDQRDGIGTRVSMVVGREDDGSPIKSFLMVIDKELYDEDQQVKMDAIDETEKSIKEGALVDVEEGYVPGGGKGISLEQGLEKE